MNKSRQSGAIPRIPQAVISALFVMKSGTDSVEIFVASTPPLAHSSCLAVLMFRGPCSVQISPPQNVAFTRDIARRTDSIFDAAGLGEGEMHYNHLNKAEEAC